MIFGRKREQVALARFSYFSISGERVLYANLKGYRIDGRWYLNNKNVGDFMRRVDNEMEGNLGVRVVIEVDPRTLVDDSFFATLVEIRRKYGGIDLIADNNLEEAFKSRFKGPGLGINVIKPEQAAFQYSVAG